MKAVAYLRVSTDRQAEQGLGLDVQLDAVRRWEKAGGHRLVAVLRDEGVSGTVEAEGRPGLAEAIDLVKAGRAEALVVARLDRLARVLTIQEAALAAVWKAGGRVFTADAGEVPEDDPDDPMRTAMRQMMGVFAQLDRASITARLRAGRRRKHEDGGYAYGAPRFGTKAEGRALVEDPAEAAVVARIAELHAEGRSLRGIARALEADGHRPRRGGRWHPAVLARIVRRIEGQAA